MDTQNLLSQAEVGEQLFGTFPRFIGPIQHRVHSTFELKSYMAAQSGITNCFVSVYQFIEAAINGTLRKNVPVIDKLFLESDYGDARTALKVGQSLFEECTETYGLSTVPIWSGNRSPHILPLFIPEIHPNPSDAIKMAAYKISYTSNNYYIDPSSKKYVPYLDSRVLEPRRLCRYYNTRRVTPSGTPSSSYCIILDPETFPDLSYKDVLELSSVPQTKPIKLSPPKTKLSEFDVSGIELNDWQGASPANSSPTTTPINPYLESSSTIRPSSIELMLNALVTRPCTRLGMSFPNPPDVARLGFVTELSKKGISAEFIIYMFSILGMYDFDLDITSRMTYHIIEKGYYPPKRRDMQAVGLCNYQDCIECKRCGKRE